MHKIYIPQEYYKRKTASNVDVVTIYFDRHLHEHTSVNLNING